MRALDFFLEIAGIHVSKTQAENAESEPKHTLHLLQALREE